MTGPLAGIRVIEFTNGVTNAQLGQMLADAGAEVIQVEPPGGSPLRSHAAFPAWGRGKQSIVLDLHDSGDLTVAQQLQDSADVVLEAFRPGVADRLGLGYSRLQARNPAAVYCSITGWGKDSPYANVPGYEGLVAAKMGIFHQYGPMIERPGPAFVATQYLTYAAAIVGFQAVLVALREREHSGHGQQVSTSLALAVCGMDPYNQLIQELTNRYPDAFTPQTSMDADYVPSTGLTFRLLIAVTKDGYWLQFSQVQERLWLAFIHACGLDWAFEDERFSMMPNFPDRQRILEFYDLLLEAVRSKTLAEWQEIFEQDHNVFAEVFRAGTELLHHPQIEHNHQVIELLDPVLGVTRQPAPIVQMSTTNCVVRSAAPAIDEHRDAILKTLDRRPEVRQGKPTTELPLKDIVVLDLGSFYAAPYGTAILTDLGARVIKVEPFSGEPLRTMLQFPEAGAAKVLAGKESLALDITRPEGREVILNMAKQANLILCSFRAGVSPRLGIDAPAFLAVNPELMFLDAPGFGTDGPYGHCPAFAPTIAAGAGVGMRNFPEELTPANSMAMDLPQARRMSARLTLGTNSSSTQPDGIAALAVGAAMALAAFAQTRGQSGQHLLTTMLHSTSHALGDAMIEYEGFQPSYAIDSNALGFGARYRLYETAAGWVFLAASTPREWDRLRAALAEFGFDADQAADEAIAAALEDIFKQRTAQEWESALLGADVPCVACAEHNMEFELMSDFGKDSGFLVNVEHPVFGEYPRVGPLMQFSRSATQALAGSTLGQHTDSVLADFGYSAEAIADLRAADLVR